jgi:hypothetical protein
MTDSGFTMEEHLARAATRADVRAQLHRCWLSKDSERETERAFAMAPGEGSR